MLTSLAAFVSGLDHRMSFGRISIVHLMQRMVGPVRSKSFNRRQGTKCRWTSSLLKGAVILCEPDGEIIVQGTPAQELIEPTDRFTASL